MKTFHAQFLLHKLHRDILSGQKIDKELQTTKEISARLLKKYYRMVTLFTGGHIKYGFLIGYVLSGKKVPYKKTVTSIGEDIGVLRQIDDDIKDYEGYHHEALGDLINHKKRLPELLFQLQASTQQKQELNTLLDNPKENHSQIRELVLKNTDIQLHISKIISETEQKISTLPENYQDQMKELLGKFSHL